MAERQFIVLYTHQKTKKAKTWQDGVLKMPSAGSKGVLFDDKGMKIDSIHVRPQDLTPGEQLESDRHYIMIEEEKAIGSTGMGEVRTSEAAVNQSRAPPLPPPQTRPQNAVRVGLKRKRTGFNPPRMVRPIENSSDGTPGVKLQTETQEDLQSPNQPHSFARNHQNSFHLRFKQLQTNQSNMPQQNSSEQNSSESISSFHPTEPGHDFEPISSNKLSSASPFSKYYRNSSETLDSDSSLMRNDGLSSPQQKIPSPWSTYGRNGLNKRNSPVNGKLNVSKNENRTFLSEDPLQESPPSLAVFHGTVTGKSNSDKGSASVKNDTANDSIVKSETSTKRNTAQILALMGNRNAEGGTTLDSVRPQSFGQCLKESDSTMCNDSSKCQDSLNVSYDWVETPTGSQFRSEEQSTNSDGFQTLQCKYQKESGTLNNETEGIDGRACTQNENQNLSDASLPAQNECRSFVENTNGTHVDDEENEDEDESEEDVAGIDTAQPDFHISFSPLSQFSNDFEDSEDKVIEMTESQNDESNCTGTISSTLKLCNDGANSDSRIPESEQDIEMKGSPEDLPDRTEQLHVVESKVNDKCVLNRTENSENDSSLNGKVVINKSLFDAGGSSTDKFEMKTLSSCQQKEVAQDDKNEPKAQEEPKGEDATKEEEVQVMTEEDCSEHTEEQAFQRHVDSKEDVMEEPQFQEDCKVDYSEEQNFQEDGKVIFSEKQTFQENSKKDVTETCLQEGSLDNDVINEQLISEDDIEKSNANAQLIHGISEGRHITKNEFQKQEEKTNHSIGSSKADSQGSFHVMSSEGNLNKLDFSQDSMANFSLFSSEEFKPCTQKYSTTGNKKIRRSNSLPFSDVECVGSCPLSQESIDDGACSNENPNPEQSKEGNYENFHSVDEASNAQNEEEFVFQSDEHALTEIENKTSEEEQGIGNRNCSLSQDVTGSPASLDTESSFPEEKQVVGQEFSDLSLEVNTISTSAETESFKNSPICENSSDLVIIADHNDAKRQKVSKSSSIMTEDHDFKEEQLAVEPRIFPYTGSSNTRMKEGYPDFMQEHFRVEPGSLTAVDAARTSTRLVHQSCVRDELNLCQTLENPSKFENLTNARTTFVKRETTPQGLVDKLSEKLTSYKMKGSLSGVGAKRQSKDWRNVSVCNSLNSTLEEQYFPAMDRSLVSNMKEGIINDEETSLFNSSLLPTETQTIFSNLERHGSCQRVPSAANSPSESSLRFNCSTDTFPFNQGQKLLTQSLDIDDLEEKCKEFIYRRPHERRYLKTTPSKKESTPLKKESTPCKKESLPCKTERIPCKKERRAMVSEPFSDALSKTNDATTANTENMHLLNSCFDTFSENGGYLKSQNKFLHVVGSMGAYDNKENENKSNSTRENSVMFVDMHNRNRLNCDSGLNSKWGKFMQEEESDELDSLLNCSFDLKASPNYKIPNNSHGLRTISNDVLSPSPGGISWQHDNHGTLNSVHQDRTKTNFNAFTSNLSMDSREFEDQNSRSQPFRKEEAYQNFAADDRRDKNWISKHQGYVMRDSGRISPNFDLRDSQEVNFPSRLPVRHQTNFTSHNQSTDVVPQFSPANSLNNKQFNQTVVAQGSSSMYSPFQRESDHSTLKGRRNSPDVNMSTVGSAYTENSFSTVTKQIGQTLNAEETYSVNSPFQAGSLHSNLKGRRKNPDVSMPKMSRPAFAEDHRNLGNQNVLSSDFAMSQRRDVQRGFQSPLITAGENANILKGSKRNLYGELQFATKSEVEQNDIPQRQCTIPCTFPSVAVYKQILTAALKEHLNIILFTLAKNYHHSMAKIDTSAYQHQPSGPNRGKATTHTSSNPVCNCGAPSKMVQVKKEGPNKGRFFFACNAQRNQQCKFFQWADQETKSGGPKSGGNDRMKMSDSGNITTYLRSQHVYFYCECQFLKKTMENIMSHFRRNVPKWVKDNYAAKNNVNEKKKYIRLSKKDSSSLFTKDDLWIVSQHFDFEPAHTFLAKSVYFGPTSGNEVEIDPITSFSPSNWPNEGNCHAILSGNISSELSYLENLQENLQFTTVPLLPHLLNREGELQTSKAFRAPVRTSTSTNIHCPDDLVGSLANEFIQQYKLNPDQEEALRRVSHMFCKSKSTDIDPILLVHGVFGAGKSFLLSLVIMFLVRVFELNDTYSPGVPFAWKVLVSSTTNVAVDRILNGLLDLGFEDFVRVGSVKKIAKPVLPYSVHATGTENQELKDLQEMLRSGDLSMAEKHHVRQSIEKHRLGENKKRLGNVKVVGVTCASCSANSLKGMKFPIVILDESSQMTEPASLLPIAKFSCERLLLVGDPKQLDPTIQGSESSHTQGLEQTLFDRLIAMGHMPTVLRTQYRCHPAISNISNTLFYNKHLIDGLTPQDRVPLKSYLPTVCFYNVSNGEESMDTDGSFSNAKEAYFVVFLIESLVASGVDPGSIGVITLYKSQMYKIVAQLGTSRNCSQKETKSTLVSTVDAFQGGERDIIILSCVRTKSVGFIDNEKRTNVALTRARNHMLIVGNKTNLKRNKLWGKIINLCESNPDGLQESSEAEEVLQTASEEACTSSIGTVNSSLTEHDDNNTTKKPKRGRKRKMKNSRNKDSQESSPPMSLSESQHSEASTFSPGFEDLTSNINLDDDFALPEDTAIVKRRNKVRLIDPTLIESDKDSSDEDLPLYG